MDRVPKTSQDFLRVSGKYIRLTTIEPVLNDKVVVGVLKFVDEEKLL